MNYSDAQGRMNKLDEEVELVSNVKECKDRLTKNIFFKTDLNEFDLDCPFTPRSEGSCRYSDISMNQYYLLKKQTIGHHFEEPTDGVLSISQILQHPENNSRQRIETPWIPLLKSDSIKVFDIIPRDKPKKNDQSTQFLNKKNDTEKLEHAPFIQVYVKKTEEMIKNENFKLRRQLHEIDIRLKECIEESEIFSKTKVNNRRGKSLERLPIVSKTRAIEIRLKVYEAEHKMLQILCEKLRNRNYLVNLKKEIDEKQKIIKKFKKDLKIMIKKQQDNSKKIENFHFSQVAKEYSSLKVELVKLNSGITQEEAEINFKTELFELNSKKESELIHKLKKLAPNSPESTKSFLSNKYEQLKIQLQELKINKTAVLAQLKVKEGSAKEERCNLMKEQLEFEEKLQKKTKMSKNFAKELKSLIDFAVETNIAILKKQDLRSKSEKQLIEKSKIFEETQELHKPIEYIKKRTPIRKKSLRAKSEIQLNIGNNSAIEKANTTLNSQSFHENVDLFKVDYKKGIKYQKKLKSSQIQSILLPFIAEISPISPSNKPTPKKYNPSDLHNSLNPIFSVNQYKSPARSSHSEPYKINSTPTLTKEPTKTAYSLYPNINKSAKALIKNSQSLKNT